MNRIRQVLINLFVYKFKVRDILLLTEVKQQVFFWFLLK